MRAPYIFHSLSSCAECGVQGESFMSPSTEAWEVTGELICHECAAGVLERWEEETRARLTDAAPAMYDVLKLLLSPDAGVSEAMAAAREVLDRVEGR